MSEPLLDPEMTTLEQSLARLEPRGQLAREEVFFRAGQASRRLRWLWPASAGISTAAAVLLGWLLWRQPAPPTNEPAPRIIYVERVVPQPSTEKPFPPDDRVHVEPVPDLNASTPVQNSEAADYLRLRSAVVRWGVDALQPTPPQKPSTQPLTPSAAPRLSTGVFGWHGF